jgi:hypothetical protein
MYKEPTKYEKMGNITTHQGNTNQNHYKISSQIQWLKKKRQKVAKPGLDVVKGKLILWW